MKNIEYIHIRNWQDLIIRIIPKDNEISINKTTSPSLVTFTDNNGTLVTIPMSRIIQIQHLNKK